MTEPPLDQPRAEELIGEMERLVRIAARRPELSLVVGESGCPWSFNWQLGRITVNPEHVRDFAPDLCRGLALHEATHAAVTRYQDMLSRTLMRRYGYLLNAIEDMRIETWMRVKFPGASPWIRAYNEALFGPGRTLPQPRSRQAQFLRGLLELWWYGEASPEALAEVTAALDAVRQPVTDAIGCQPPLGDNEAGIVEAQRAMWTVVRARIVPVWDRLVAADSAEGIGELAHSEMAEMLGMPGGDSTVAGESVRRLPGTRAGGSSRGSAAATGRGGRLASDAISASLGTDGRDDYLAAWRRVAPLARHLGDELLHELVPSKRLRWTAGHPTGTRLDIRLAMQFSADPRLYRSLWLRPVVPNRRDPAFVLLLDKSGSMSGGNRMAHAFDAMVLLIEVCRRVGVPVAAWSFSTTNREELSIETPLDDTARRRLGRLLRSCDGATHLAPALAAVRDSMARGRGDPKILMVLSDGEPDAPEDVVAEVRRLERDMVHPIGLGLGDDTSGLARFFERAITGIPPSGLVGRIGALIRQSLLASGGGERG